MIRLIEIDGQTIACNVKCMQPPGFPCIHLNNRDCQTCSQATITLEAPDFWKLIRRKTP